MDKTRVNEFGFGGEEADDKVPDASVTDGAAQNEEEKKTK